MEGAEKRKDVSVPNGVVMYGGRGWCLKEEKRGIIKKERKTNIF